MIKKIIAALSFFLILLNSIAVNAEDGKYVQIFDPKQAKVVKAVEVNQEIQDIVVKWITNIQGRHGKMDPITDDGYAVKVPLDPEVKVNSTWLNANVKEVYIIIPEKEPPFLGIFIKEDILIYYLFEGDIDMLSKSLDFKLK